MICNIRLIRVRKIKQTVKSIAYLSLLNRYEKCLRHEIKCEDKILENTKWSMKMKNPLCYVSYSLFKIGL